MDNLRYVALGLIVVAVDLRFEGIDFLTDALGWVVAGASLAGLAQLHAGFRVAAFACLAGLVAWAGDPWLGIDQDITSSVEYVAQTVVAFAVCTALMSVVPKRRRTADLIRWWDLALSIFIAVLAAALDGETSVTPLVLLLIVPVVWVFVAFLVLLFRCAREQPATASA
jgi:hypothetical protein